MTELYTCYASYLDRMIEQSEDLVCIAEETIPSDVNLPLLEEWGYSG